MHADVPHHETQPSTDETRSATGHHSVTGHHSGEWGQRHHMTQALVIAGATMVPMICTISAIAAHVAMPLVIACLVVSTIAAVVLTVAQFERILFASAQAQARHEEEQGSWRHKALNDHLTSVANRHGVTQLVEECVAGQRDLRWSVLVCDVDRFKRINDSYGHPVGDRALSLIASTLEHHCPAGAHVGRLGGDEFVVFSPDPEIVTAEWADDVLDRLLSTPLETREGKVQLSFTWGLAAGRPGEAFDDVLNAADRYLVAKKEAVRAGSDPSRVVLPSHRRLVS